jgi:acyl-CoA synthetase (AMP-forming)/AMP-acid ligase II
MVLHDGVDPERVRPLLAGGLEAMFAAPTVLAKLTAAFAGAELPGLRTIFTGTAPLPPLLYERVRGMFGRVVRVTYGKTEVVNPITILRPEETDSWYAEGGGADGAACVGWPGQGVEVVIDGEAEGEVLLRAAHMSEGTLDGDFRVVPWRADGFHATGDVGRIDELGRLHLVARLSDAMKSGGYKIYPQEIERALAPAGDAVVVGFPSDYWGEIIVAVAEDAAPGWEVAAKAACGDLAPFKRPRFHASVAALPRNGQGKVVRRLLLAELQRQWRLVDGPRPVFERIG